MPKVSIILTHQLDCNKKYLDLALRGLAAQTFTDFELQLISGAELAPECGFNFDGRLNMHWDRSFETATKKINWAIANSDSEYILLHSDDVLMSKYCLDLMIKSPTIDQAITNPLSNSDCRSLYYTDLFASRPSDGLTKLMTHDMDYEDIVGFEESIINLGPQCSIIIPVQTLSFYCTLIPRRVWEQVGGVDPELEYRHNDQDFCLRAKKLGIHAVVNLEPFAFHFGTKTLNHLSDDVTKNKATIHFMNKHGLR